MCRAMEQMRDETAHETAIKIALTMLADGLPYEQVAKYAGLSIEEVRALDERPRWCVSAVRSLPPSVRSS